VIDRQMLRVPADMMKDATERKESPRAFRGIRKCLGEAGKTKISPVAVVCDQPFQRGNTTNAEGYHSNHAARIYLMVGVPIR
jgi:hypothetical protein